MTSFLTQIDTKTAHMVKDEDGLGLLLQIMFVSPAKATGATPVEAAEWCKGEGLLLDR